MCSVIALNFALVLLHFTDCSTHAITHADTAQDTTEQVYLPNSLSP